MWHLDSDSSSLDYLCQLADCLGHLKETESEFSISYVNFSCCFQHIPQLSLSTKILSIGMRCHPQQLIKNMEDFISDHTQMQTDTQKLCHFASKQTGCRGIEPPGNCLTGVLIGNTTEYPAEVASKLGDFCERKKQSAQPPRMLSCDVTKKVAFSLSGIRRLGRYDLTNGDRWCYMEAALSFGHDSRSTNTLLTENGCPWNLSKIARSPIWEMGDLYSQTGLEWTVEFQVPISALPKHTRLCFTFCYIPRVLKASPKCLTHKLFFDCDENSASFSLVDWNALYDGDEELRLDSLVDSYVIIPLFDSDGSFYFRKKNLTFSPAPANDLDFNILFSPIGSFYQPMKSDPAQTDIVVVDRFKCISFDKRHKRAGKHLKYGRAPEIKFIANSPSWSFSANLQKRNYLKCFEELEQLDWSNKLFVDQLESDLDCFKSHKEEGCDLTKPDPPLWIGLKLLTYKFSSQAVRAFAVICLENVDDEMLRPLMSPLVQALKFDNSLNSELAQFLFSRALLDISMGYQLCWLLLVECENVTYKGFYLALLQSFLKNCKPRICRQFLKALLTDKEMSKWATSVQLAYHKYSPQAAHYSLMRSISAFEDVSAPYESSRSCFYLGRVRNTQNGSIDQDDEGVVASGGFKFRVPLCNLYNPRIKVKSIDKTKCKIMNSKKLPLWLSFELQDGDDTGMRAERHTLLVDDGTDLIFPSIRMNSSNTFTTNETLENLGRDVRIMSLTKTDPELIVSEQDIHDQDITGEDSLLDIRGSLTLMVPEHAEISLLNNKSNRDSLLSMGSFSELDSPGPYGERKLTTFSLTIFDSDTRLTSNFLEVFNMLTSRNLEIYEIRWASSKAAISEKERGINLQSSLTNENSVEGQNSKRSLKKTESTRSRSPSISSTPTASAHNSYIGEHPDERHFPGDEDLRHELENGVKLTPTTFLEDSMVVVADVNERYRSEHQISPPLMGLLEVNKGNDEALSETELSASEFCEIDPESLYLDGGLTSAQSKMGKRECEMIYKAGDDLRQDALVMQLFELMLNIWRDKPVMKHIVLRRYGCLASSQNTGAIEVVQDAVTLCKTQHIYNARLNRRKDYWDKESLKRWLEENNPPSRMPAVKERFFWSALGSCVATFVLGIGDRHSDNMMIERDGTFLHIDFGHILGNFKKFKMIARETTPFFFTPDFVEVLDGAGSATYTKFKTYFVQAYMHLREHAHLFVAIFELMLGAGMPELRFPEHINFLKDKMLILDDNSSSAEEATVESTAAMSMGERNKDIHSKIMDIFDSAAANQRQILNQRIHQLK
ncbi:uncharacterized protein LOC142341675 isoform X3 [Convolutriloba macropyga]